MAKARMFKRIIKADNKSEKTALVQAGIELREKVVFSGNDYSIQI